VDGDDAMGGAPVRKIVSNRVCAKYSCGLNRYVVLDATSRQKVPFPSAELTLLTEGQFGCICTYTPAEHQRYEFLIQCFKHVNLRMVAKRNCRHNAARISLAHREIEEKNLEFERILHGQGRAGQKKLGSPVNKIQGGKRERSSCGIYLGSLL
jgi:hypothetical protein